MHKPIKNSPKLWDNLWKNHVSSDYQATLLAQEKLGIRWQRLKKLVIQNFGSFKNLKVIELGAGTGVNALLMAKLGAKVTILDYSSEALKRSKEIFAREKVPATFVLADALKLPSKLKVSYDISMSFGLAEHFLEPKRTSMIKAHLDLLKPTGLTIISVPNSWNLPYRLFKFFAQLTPLWHVGEEYPFSRLELQDICKSLNTPNFFFIGDSLIKSFNFINPIWLVSRMKKLPEHPTREVGTSLDPYFSYALVLIASKHAL